MEDDDLEITFDPYDLLQEHDLLIQRLIKSHNNQDKFIRDLAKQHQEISEFLIKTNQRLTLLEDKINDRARR